MVSMASLTPRALGEAAPGRICSGQTDRLRGVLSPGGVEVGVMAPRNTGHLDPSARPRPTLTAITGLLFLMLFAGVAAYVAARVGLL